MKKIGIVVLALAMLLSLSGAVWANCAESPELSVSPTCFFKLYAPIPKSNFNGNFTVQSAEWIQGYKQVLPGQLQIPYTGCWTLFATLGNITGMGGDVGNGDTDAAKAFRIYGGQWGDFDNENDTKQIGTGSGTTPRNIYYRWDLNELNDSYGPGRTGVFNVDFYYTVS